MELIWTSAAVPCKELKIGSTDPLALSRNVQSKEGPLCVIYLPARTCDPHPSIDSYFISDGPDYLVH
jgi:hypothetical protein